jgi:hypothetical protein
MVNEIIWEHGEIQWLCEKQKSLIVWGTFGVKTGEVKTVEQLILLSVNILSLRKTEGKITTERPSVSFMNQIKRKVLMESCFAVWRLSLDRREG